jgi:DNA polymerase III subunit gamma/tau
MTKPKKLNFFYDKRALSLALRPKSFKTMFGQDETISAIRKLVKSNKEHKVWMFTGHPGVGKTSFARILSIAFNCHHFKGSKFGSYCSKCRDGRHDLNISEVDGAKFNTVEHVTKLIEAASYAPTPPSKYRIVILDEAQRLSKESQTLLLKPLEPKNIGKTIWIFCTTMYWKIDPAIRSRAMIFNVPNLKHKVIDEFVKASAEKAEITRDLDDFLEYLHEHDISAPRNILMMLEKFGAGMDPDKAAAVAELDVNTMRICKGIAAGEWSRIRAELDRATPDDVRLVRAALLGYFRQQLMQRTPSMSRKLIVTAIEQLSDIPYSIEEVSQLALLSARVYSLTEKFKKA